MEINGQVALITGAASGMGAETARCLVEAGAKVGLFDREIAKAKAVAKELGNQAIAVACDVTEPESTSKAIAALREEFGPPRIAVSCAGIAPAARIVGREGPMPLEDFSQVIQVNLIGTFNLMRLAAAKMLPLDTVGDDGERGVIINTASVAAYEGQIGQAAYSASKGGVVAMTLPAAREFARFGVRVVTIAPGLIETPLLLDMPDKVRANLIASLCFPKRLGKPSEFAELVQHIISNPLINGEVIRLDGAVRMVA